MSGRYRILHPLESGPDIRVYLVADRWESMRPRVLTLLSMDMLQEAQRLHLEKMYSFRKSLDHPVLIHIQDLAFRGKQVGLISDYVSDPSLLKRLQEHSFPQPEFLALELAELLAYLHHRHFFLGYLKPSRFFVASGGRLRANLLAPQPRPGVRLDTVDSIRYAVPEFLAAGTVNDRSDLYSLGMLFYHLFTGHPPFAGGEVDTLRQKQLATEPVRPRKLKPDLSRETEKLIVELIQKDPGLRPPSAEYVATVLRDKSSSQSDEFPRFRSELVGRDREMTEFRGLLEQYLSNPTSTFVEIGGASGIGKTRLVERFETISKIRRAKTYVINHHPGTGILEGFRQVSERIYALGEQPTEIAKDRSLAHPENFLGSFVRLLKQSSRKHPIVLCVNDLHWMDEGSLEVYKSIFRAENLAVLVIGNYRSDELPGHWHELRSKLYQEKLLRELNLDPLTDSQVLELTKNSLGQLPSQELLSSVVSQCAGNPFYVYELLRFSHQSGELSFRSGRWQGEPLVEGTKVPGTVTEHIQRRLQGLDPEQLRTLEYLAVLDKPASMDLVASMVDRVGDGLFEGVQFLDRLDFVTITGSLDRPIVDLSHDWLRQVIRKQITRDRIQAIHRHIASILETEYLKSNVPFLAVGLVRHYTAARSGRKVKKYIWDAVRWLEKGRLYREAAQMVEQACQCGAVSVKRWENAKGMIELFYLSGQLDKCISLSKEMLSGTPKLSPGQRALVLFFLARAHIVRGESTAVIPALEDGLLLLRNSEDMDLYGELQGQLLCCLVHKGEHARARKLAQRIVKNFFRYRSRSSLDKVYHALFFHSYYLEGNVPQAIKSEAFAIEHALQHRKYIRYGGRLLALSVVYAEIGRLSSVERFIKHTLELADEVGNTELSNLARIIFCLKNRKEGRHANALLELSELVVVNQRSNRNQYWATELHIEIGKNFNCQLLPERALAYLEKAKRLLKTNPIFSSSIDAVLALGWTWLLLGQPKKALKVVSVLNSETIPRERGRYFFLRAQARLALGDLELAWQDARRARQCFPEYIPYYRARACLVLSDILLAKGSLGKARRYIQEGLKIAKKEFYFPFMVKGYVLHAKWLAATGNHSKARVYCMRALQVADRVERPGLRAEIYHTLAAVEVALGRREKAVESFAAALYILKERLLHLSPRYRKSFESQFIEPIQADRDRLLLDSPSTAPRYLVNVRHFAGSLREVHHLKELGEKVLKARATIKRCGNSIGGEYPSGLM